LRCRLGTADVIKVGEREVAMIAGRLGIVDPVAAARRGARLVAKTRGAAGSTWFAPGIEPVESPPPASRRR
jgi:sugar/nucleoside kinase (ribokinase family)